MKTILRNRITKTLWVLMFLFSATTWGQTLFTETMGTCCGSTTTAIASTVFDNAGLTFTGTADTRTSTASSGYAGASGSRNVFITNSVGRDFVISGINTSSYTSLVLSFGHYKSTTASNNELVVEVGSDGLSYTALTYSRATGSGTANWTLITASGTIPSVSNLYIRFRQTSATPQFRIDDVKLVGTLVSGTPVINPSVASLPTFGNVNVSTNSASQNFTVSGNDLTDVVAVAASTDYEVSTDDITFSSGFNLGQTGGDLDGEPVTIYVRYSPTSGGLNNGTITFTSTDATTKTVTVSGTGVVPTPEIFVSTTSLASFGDVLVGNSSSSSSFTVSGDLLTEVVAVAAPADFEVSTDDITFTSGFNLGQTGGNLDGEPVTVYVRFSPGSVGAKSGDISLTSTGADAKTVSVSGTGTSPVIAEPTAIAAGDVTTNSFTANWEEVSGATNYRLDVSTSPDFEVSNLATDLIISEYIEGSATNKLIEIYNGTGATVDLSDYQLQLYSNGGITPVSLTLSGTLTNGATLVYENTAQTIYAGAVIAANTVVNYNGDDAVALYKISTASLVDVFGEIGNDPGSAWTVSGNTTVNKTLVRNSTVNQGALSSPGFPTLGTEWTMFDQDTASNLGSHAFDAFLPSYVAGYQDLTVAGLSQSVTGLAEGTTYYYRVRAFDGTTSINSNVISLTTLISPPTFGSITQNEVLCQGSEVMFTISGLVPGSTSTISYTIGGGATQTFTDAVADGSGNASIAVILNAVNDGQELVVTAVERTDLPTTILNPSSGNTIILEVLVATLYYFDFDGDGYGIVDDSVLSCEAPFGYVALSGDCDDNNIAINPGATEICYDGIDQNCDGNLMNSCSVITSTLRAEDCGASLATLSQVVRGNSFSQSIPSGVTVTGYRFKVTNLLTSEERIVERANYIFQLTYTDFADYNTPYSVEVALRLNQEWMETYGAPCTITTPGVPNTVLAATSCGATLAQMNSIIRAAVVPSAISYEFEVSLIEGAVAVETTTLVKTGESLNLLQLTGISIKYGAEYSVRVKVQVPTSSGPQWSTEYGTACSVFTPLAPEASIEGCGAETGIAPAAMTTTVYASPIGGATQYKFTLTDGMAYTQTYTTPSRYFKLSNFNALQALTPGGTYSVTVEVQIYGFYYPGKDCNILVPGGAPIVPFTRAVVDTDNAMGEFKAVAYPNPFNNSFALDLRTSSTNPVSIAIYDMTGRLLETNEYKADSLAKQTIGERYPAGVYNVIVTQGENMQTVRVVKK